MSTTNSRSLEVDERSVMVRVSNTQAASSSHSNTRTGLICFSANTVLVTTLLPYISPVVLPSMDVQLMALGTSVGVILGLLFLTPGLFSFGREDALILGMGLFSMVYVNPDVAFDDFSATLRACGQIVFAFPIYYAVRNLYRYMSPRIFLAVVVLYCGALYLQVQFPAVYESTFAHMLSDTRWHAEEGRGPNGLCTEPSMMGNMCSLFIVSLYFFHKEYWKHHRRAALSVIAASCVMLIITTSGTGVVLALIVAAAALFSSNLSRKAKAAILAASLLAFLSLGPLLSSSESRGASVLSVIAGNPLSILGDSSFAERLSGVYVGLIQIPEAPLGSFDVRVNSEATNSALNGDLALFLWPNTYLRSILIDLRLIGFNNHGIGDLFDRMGLFGLLISTIMVFLVRGFPGKWVVRIFLVGLFLNASMFMPTLWFVLGCCIELRGAECRDPKMIHHGLVHALWRQIVLRARTDEQGVVGIPT